MEPQTRELIASWPNMSEEEAKLLFIRKSAQEAYEQNNIKEATKSILKEIVVTSTVNSMSREEIGLHIANLEKARSFLAAFTQGLMIGLSTELEPIFKAKRIKEAREKTIAKSSGSLSAKDKRINDLVEMARNLSLASNESAKEAKPIKETTKVVCPTCGNETFSLKFHKCPV